MPPSTSSTTDRSLLPSMRLKSWLDRPPQIEIEGHEAAEIQHEVGEEDFRIGSALEEMGRVHRTPPTDLSGTSKKTWGSPESARCGPAPAPCVSGSSILLPLPFLLVPLPILLVPLQLLLVPLPFLLVPLPFRLVPAVGALA